MWHNDAGNSALITGKKIIFKNIQIENILKCNNISQYYVFFYSLSEQKTFPQKY